MICENWHQKKDLHICKSSSAKCSFNFPLDFLKPFKLSDLKIYQLLLVENWRMFFHKKKPVEVIKLQYPHFLSFSTVQASLTLLPPAFQVMPVSPEV